MPALRRGGHAHLGARACLSSCPCASVLGGDLQQRIFQHIHLLDVFPTSTQSDLAHNIWVKENPTALLLQMCEVERERGDKGKADFNAEQVSILQALYLHLKLLKSSKQRKLQGVGHVMGLIL